MAIFSKPHEISWQENSFNAEKINGNTKFSKFSELKQ